MKFASVALLALAAGVQAGTFTQAEPDVQDKAMHQITGTAASSSTHPMMTGTASRGTASHGNSTVMVTSTAACHKGKCTSTPAGSSSTPVATPSSTSTSTSGSGSGSGGGSGGGAGNTPSSPSSTGAPSPNPGSKLAVPMAGAALGSVAYGLLFLA